ncbi:MAG TPA: hypothetical protein VF867_01280 [Arthrobacter sp.]
MSAPARVHAGVPAGGEFTATAHSESPVALGASAPLLSLGDMSEMDPIYQGVVRTRMGQLREAGMTGHATDFETIDGWGVRFNLENQDGTFKVSLNDDQVAITRGEDNPLDPAHTWVADANIVTRYRDPAVTAEQIMEAYGPAMTRSRTARRWTERSGLRSNHKVRFGLPELIEDESGRKVGSLTITLGDAEFTVLMPRGTDKPEVYLRTYRPLTPRMTAALLEDATEAGGGPAGTDMIGNAIAVTLLEEGEAW